MKGLLFSLGFLSLLNFNAHALKVYLLSNHDNAGDHNQVLGIEAALEKIGGQKITSEDLNTKITIPLDIKDKIKKDLAKEIIIVVASGEGGIDGIKDITTHPNLIICLTSHMFLERYNDPNILAKVNYIALPVHAAEPYRKLLGAKLIETTGVAHNRQPDQADKVYKEWGTAELDYPPSFLVAVLGGDAPTPPPSKDIKLFTKDDAAKLADYVAKNAKDATIIVLNGPRTGKHDKNKQEVKTVHRNGYSDPITTYFVEILQSKGIKDHKIKVFDFQHNTPENKDHVLPFNAFDLAIGALRDSTRGMILVPGESTSMISEAVDSLPPRKVLVYKDSPMNEIHEAHVNSELCAGRVSVLEDYQTLVAPSPEACTTTSKFSAASIIAQKLLDSAQPPKPAKRL